MKLDLRHEGSMQSERGRQRRGRTSCCTSIFFFANRVDGAFVGQPNRASCQVAQPSGAKSLDSNAKLAMLGSKETLLDAYPAVLVAQVAVWGAKSSHTEPNRTSQGTPDRLATRPADRAGPKIHKPRRAISILMIITIITILFFVFKEGSEDSRR